MPDFKKSASNNNYGNRNNNNRGGYQAKAGTQQGNSEREKLGYLTACEFKDKETGEDKVFWRGALADGNTYYINIARKKDDNGNDIFTISRMPTPPKQDR